MSADRPGIVAAVSGAVLELSGNIVALSQTVLNEYFTIILIADFPERVTAEHLRKQVENAAPPGEFSVMVRPYETTRVSSPFLSSGANQYVLSATGLDRKGIIHRISRTLADRDINILDIATYLKGDQFVLVAQIVVPPDVDVRCLQDKLSAIATSHSISINLQHIDIFKETNRI
jgi:glycine cleavage system transcriptional repressor